MKAHFFKSALPANAGIHGELENGLRWGHRPQRSLGTRIGRISALALVCAMGAGAAAGQEGDAYSGEDCYATHSGGECYIKDKPVSLQLQPVSIEGRRTSANETAASISVIGGEEIERINALRLGDVLANVPGVFFSGLNGPRETPQILSLIHI